MTLLALSGYAGAGKDAAAGWLVGNYGWRRVAFADRLRDFTYALNPLLPALHADSAPLRLRTYVDAVGWEYAKRQHPEVRALLQRCGTDAGRRILGDDVWVDATLDTVDPALDTVIPDCRFENEARRVRELGGIVGRILRPGVHAVNGHASERALDGFDFDFEVVNDQDIDTLGARILTATQAAVSASLAAFPDPRTPGEWS